MISEKLKKALFALQSRKMNSSSSSNLNWYWAESRMLIDTLSKDNNQDDENFAQYWMEDAPSLHKTKH